MSRLVGCDAAGCDARYVARVPGDALSNRTEDSGWVEARVESFSGALIYDLCPAHAALLSDDQWRARLTPIIDYAKEPPPAPAGETGGPLAGEGAVAPRVLACNTAGDDCGWPARDHCSLHNPRHCPSVGCPG